ncbi:MAG: TIGR03435 family protein [Vicinamibacterales bacterium]
MKTGIQILLRRYMRRYGEPPREHVAATVERVWRTLEPQAAVLPPPALAQSATTVARADGRSLDVRYAAAAVLIVAAAVGSAMLWRPADDAVYRIVEGNVYQGGPPSLLRSVGRTGTIRSNGGGGAVLALLDGSRIEMRSQTELALERAGDGMRIRLHRGGIIVNAAKQRTGHLYVATKDMTVSVIGTVFMVDAEEQGSRVLVIEGEVRVQRGTTETKLLPGEQVATSPAMASPPITEGIAWSRNAGTLVGLLQQTAATPPALAPQNPAPSRPAFEVVSIRPSVPKSGGRGGGGLPGYFPDGACSGFPQIDPRRFAVNNVTVVTLIARAYGAPGRNCKHYEHNRVLGGTGWITADQFDLEATIPAGLPSYTVRQYDNNLAPGLQAMLQAMLVDRFQLVVRRETREMPVEVLTLGRSKDAGQLTEAAAESIRQATRADVRAHFAAIADGTFTPAEGTVSTEGDGLWGVRASMAEIASYLTRVTGKPLVDRTGLTVNLTFYVPFERPPDGLRGIQGFFRPLSPTSLASLRKALREQLGLELEAGTGPVDVLVVERVERPTEN